MTPASVKHFRQTIAFLSLTALTSSGMSPVNLGAKAVTGGTLPPGGQAAPARDISILTYNIEGLPWPLALGRPAALAAIERRLRELRFLRRQPQVLVLQEAFTAEAKAVGVNSGYPFVIMGGGATDLRDSGLEIASDLPIIDVRRLTYPACAGFDCLARKGAMLVTVALPSGTRMQVVATHLNSHRASGSDDADANRAYYEQVDELSEFIRANRNPSLPLVVAGDFNTFPPVRKAYLEQISRWWSPSSRPIVDATNLIAPAVRRDKDRQFYAWGRSAIINPLGLTIVFGREPDGTMLSDHIGYAIRYRTALVSRG